MLNHKYSAANLEYLVWDLRNNWEVNLTGEQGMKHLKAVSYCVDYTWFDELLEEEAEEEETDAGGRY